MKYLKSFVFITFSILAFYACSSSSTDVETTNEPTTKTVKTTKAEAVDYNESVFAVGQLASAEELKLSFKTGGVIRSVNVAEGQRVRKGQILAELNLDEIKAQNQQAYLGIRQAEIDINNAQLAVDKAQRDYDNMVGLYADSVATLNQVKDAKIQLDNALNQFNSAQNGLDFNKKNANITNFNLSYSKIVAPTNGVILKKVASANELVGPGNPVVLFGTEDKAQVIRVNLTDKDIIHVKQGDQAEVTFDAYPSTIFAGEVLEVGSMADPYTGTYEVEIAVDRNGKELLSGFIGKVNIVTSNASQLVRIPVDALISADKDKAKVFVINENKATLTSVVVHKMEGSHLLISGGVNHGDEIVISGAAYLSDSEPVHTELEISNYNSIPTSNK